jgi:integrase
VLRRRKEHRMQLADTTLRDYMQAVRRWEASGRPSPAEWVAQQVSPDQARKVRAALIWHHRTTLGVEADIPFVPQRRRVPTAFSDEEVACVREAALGVHPRCRPVIDLLYMTGARLSELCAVQLADVTDSHVVFRETKRRPGGLRVERAIPLSATSREACTQLRFMGPGRLNNLIGAGRRPVQNWMVTLEGRTGIRCHAHKFRTTFCTHLLQRGVPVHEVRVLMGHSSLATTMRYAAVTDKRLAEAVALL